MEIALDPALCFYLAMISLTTAKLLLFIALCLGPKDITHSILITSNSGNLVWTQGSHGWNLDEKTISTHDWPANGLDIGTPDLNTFSPGTRPTMRAIAHHNWNRRPVLYLDNGDRVEKHGTKVFYTVRPGNPTQKVYTILYIENGIPL